MTTDEPALRPGALVASRYEIVRQLGQGGMATVLEVRDIRTERSLALKILKPEIAAHEEAVERFRREGEFLSSLKHPALVAVESIGALPDGRLFLAMELLVGETLGDRIRRGRLPPSDISALLAGAAVGLDAAHRAGVVHRDLKPDNVFLARPKDGGPVQVKLLDFGISKIDGRASLTRTGQVLGTPRYMAPEQLRGEEDLDARVDVYSLGVILYEALAGVPAFPAAAPSDLILSILNGKTTPLRAVRPDVSPELEAVVSRAMSTAREARYGSAIELAQAWFDVVHRDDGPQGVRTGVSTEVLGNMLESIRPPSPFGQDDLRPATFREFERRGPATMPGAVLPLGLDGPSDVTTPPAARPRVVASAPAADVRSGSPEAAAPLGATHKVAPASPREPAGPAPSDHAPSAAPSPSARVDGGRAPGPSSARRIGPLLVIAFLAVALVGLGVGLGAFLQSRRATPAAPVASAPPGLAARPVALDVPSARPPTVPTAAAPIGAAESVRAAAPSPSTPALDGAVQSSDTRAGSVRPDEGASPRAPRSMPAPTPVPTPAPTPQPVRPEATPVTDPPTAGDASDDVTAVLARARRAEASGDPRACVELATEAIARGAGASAYRLRGDCYRALSDAPHALRSYQRYCTLAPNAADVAAVRRAAEALGGSCP